MYITFLQCVITLNGKIIAVSCCVHLQALMHISGGSGHFYLSRDPPSPYTANTTYTAKQPRLISVSCITAVLTYMFNSHNMFLQFVIWHRS